VPSAQAGGDPWRRDRDKLRGPEAGNEDEDEDKDK
jgi:hypothetical protein